MNSKAAKQVYSESGKVVFMIVDTGTYTIRGEGSERSVEKQVPLMNLFSGYETVLCNLEESSWDIISRISRAGCAMDTWQVGDIKNITINGTRYEFAIMDFDTYDVVDSSSYGRDKNGITFGIVNCMTTLKRMNPGSTNVGGWGASEMKQTCNGFTLDSDLLNVLVYCKIPYCGTYTSVTLSYDTSNKLFLPSYAEVFGSQSYSYEPKSKEGSQFAYYANGGSKVKAVSGSDSIWWLRSVSSDSSNYFCYVSGDGSVDRSGASATLGCAPCFCV